MLHLITLNSKIKVNFLKLISVTFTSWNNLRIIGLKRSNDDYFPQAIKNTIK